MSQALQKINSINQQNSLFSNHKQPSYQESELVNAYNNFGHSIDQPFNGATFSTPEHNVGRMNQILLNSSIVVDQIHKLCEEKKNDKDFYQLLRYEANQIEY